MLWHLLFDLRLVPVLRGPGLLAIGLVSVWLVVSGLRGLLLPASIPIASTWFSRHLDLPAHWCAPVGRASCGVDLLEQSKALTTLVTQLQSGGDPLLDAPSSSSGFSLGSKGSAGRMQLQTELSNRSGAFFLQVAQNASRRLRPAAKAPVDIPAVASTDFSMVTYLERFGGYGGCRELGLVQYCLAHIFDAALHSDLEGVREHLALTMVAVEQATQDSGRWDLAYQLTLLEDPPSQMWAFRSGGSMNPRLRAFAPLCPQKWATIALAYLKEVDYIQSRRSDLKKPPTAAAGSPDAALTPSPKRKRNPKGRPREGAEEQQQDK